MMQRINFNITFKDYLELLPPDCTHSVIFSGDGTIWAVSDGWTFTGDDAKMIFELMKDPVEAVKKKFKLGQRTYLVVFADANTLVARRREFGVMVAKCKMYYVLGFCDHDVSPVKCLKSVQRVADMLRKTAQEAPNQQKE